MTVSTIIRSTASGSTADFSVPFSYLDKTHVQVRLNGVLKTYLVDYTFTTNSIIHFAAGNPTAGTVVERKRVTPTDPLTNFSPGNLDTGDLNVSILQPLYVAQEGNDAAADILLRAWFTASFGNGGTITVGPDGTILIFDASGNVVPGPNASDIEGFADAAAASAASALAAQAAAESASSAAAVAAAAAIAAANSSVYGIVANRTAAKALNPAIIKEFSIVGEGGRNGKFSYRLTSSLSAAEQAMAAADAVEGVYFANGSYTATRLDGWYVTGEVAAVWFGAKGDYLVNATDDSAAIQAAANMAATLGLPLVTVGPATYGIGSQIVLPRNVGIRGPGYRVGTRWDTAGAAWVHGRAANFAITHQPATKNEANSTFLLTSGCGLKGVAFWYPNQPLVITGALAQYAPTIGLAPDPITANNVVANAYVEDCYTTNPYTFLSWTNNHGDCRLNNIHGTFLKAGFVIDRSYDVDRITDIQFNPNNAYVAAWATNGVLKAQFDNAAVFMEIAQADQPYLDRVFCYGGFTGLLLSDRGNGSVAGMALGTCGFEGAQQPIVITGNPQECDFGYTQVGVQKGSIAGYPGQHGILISPSGNPKNLNFSRCRSFGSVGSAIQAANVNGLNLNGFRAANADDKGDFARGVVSLSGCTDVQANGMMLAIGTSAGMIVHIVTTNMNRFAMNDNMLSGTASTWGSFTSASNGEARRNRLIAGTVADAPFINGAVQCVFDPLATTINGLAIQSTLAADRAGSDVATAQNIFGSAADEFTLEASTLYDFEGQVELSRAAGTTSHTFALLFGGTATLTSIDYFATVLNPTGNVLASMQGLHVTAATAAVLTAANTSATEYISVTVKGQVRVNAKGTLIPQFQYSAAPGGAPTIKRGSSFRFWPVGKSTMTTQGQVA